MVKVIYFFALHKYTRVEEGEFIGTVSAEVISPISIDYISNCKDDECSNEIKFDDAIHLEFVSKDISCCTYDINVHDGVSTITQYIHINVRVSTDDTIKIFNHSEQNEKGGFKKLFTIIESIKILEEFPKKPIKSIEKIDGTYNIVYK